MNRFTAAFSIWPVFPLLLFVSCGSKVPLSPNSTGAPAANVESSAELAGKAVPFQVEVVDELNDGHYLYLKVNLTARVKWDLSRLIIRLTGLDSGRIVRVQHYSVSGLIEEKGSEGREQFIQPGESKTLSLMLASDALSDYQLELLWGDEAAPLLTAAAAEKVRAVNLERLEIKKRYQCATVPCDIYFTFQAQLKNGTPQILQKVTLGISFIIVKKNSNQILAQTDPEEEVMLEVNNLNLAPGAARLLKIDFDQPVSELAEAEYKPVIRVVKDE